MIDVLLGAKSIAFYFKKRVGDDFRKKTQIKKDIFFYV